MKKIVQASLHWYLEILTNEWCLNSNPNGELCRQQFFLQILWFTPFAYLHYWKSSIGLDFMSPFKKLTQANFKYSKKCCKSCLVQSSPFKIVALNGEPCIRQLLQHLLFYTKFDDYLDFLKGLVEFKWMPLLHNNRGICRKNFCLHGPTQGSEMIPKPESKWFQL